MRLFFIGLGGFVGSVLRYWISGLVQDAAPRNVFPIGTLAVNIVGCLTIGLLSELIDTRGFLSPDTRALVIIGLLGGFTTFSAFANETMNSLRDGALTIAFANILVSVASCLLAVWAGRALAHLFWR